MKRILPLMAVVLTLALTACGYRQASDKSAPFVLPEKARALFITKVENPTMDPDVESILRAEIRDEFTRRGHVTWVDRDKATAYLKIKVNQFTTSTSLTDENDDTVKSSAYIDVDAWITDKDSGKELWHGTASHSESFTSDQEAAEADVLEMVARKLTNRLAQDY